MSGPKTPADPTHVPAQSRRQLFRLAAGLALGGVGLGLSGAAIAQSKVDKTTAKYQDHPNNGQKCSECRFFLAPKSCVLVSGDISPNGWCSYFAKKGA